MESKEQLDIYTLIIISTLGILVLVLFLVFIILLYQKRMLAHKAILIDTENKHQKKLLNASLEIAEEERIKIATNVHDDIGLMLNTLKFNLDRAKKNTNNDEMLQEILFTCFKNIDDSLQAVRAIYNDIMPPTLFKLGFIKGVKELCNQLNNIGISEVKFSLNDTYLQLDKKTEIQLYRIIKEVLNNTIKHAKPTLIEIIIENVSDNLFVSITHNGKGVTNEMIKQFAKESNGLGLKSIITRAELINAQINFNVLDDQIAKVVITTPYGS